MPNKPTLLLTCFISLLAACTNDGTGPSRSEIEAAHRDGGRVALCTDLSMEGDCDLCLAFDLYDDGVCDDFCPREDGDCGAPCGGIAGLSCADGYSCEYEACGGADCGGTCVVDAPGARVPCGGVAGDLCPSGQRCVDVPDDGCDPTMSECPGVCTTDPVTPPASCGGFAGTPCPDGLVCVDVPGDDCDDLAADCIGMCVTEPPTPPSPTGCGGFAGTPLRRWPRLCRRARRRL